MEFAEELMPPTPKILSAVETDLPAIARLAKVIWRAHYPGIISSEQIEYMLAKMYSLEVMRNEVRRQGIHYEQFFVDKKLAGFASYGPTEESKTYKLHKIYLHPRWHGQGMGTLLLRHCEREVLRLGATRLLLAVNKKNSKAIAAYERNGFSIKEPICADIGSGFVMDDYIMAKELPGQQQ